MIFGESPSQVNNTDGFLLIRGNTLLLPVRRCTASDRARTRRTSYSQDEFDTAVTRPGLHLLSLVEDRCVSVPKHRSFMAHPDSSPRHARELYGIVTDTRWSRQSLEALQWMYSVQQKNDSKIFFKALISAET